jgi:hypothetical protein
MSFRDLDPGERGRRQEAIAPTVKNGSRMPPTSYTIRRARTEHESDAGA